MSGLWKKVTLFAVAIVALVLLGLHWFGPAHDKRMILHSVLGVGKVPGPQQVAQRLRVPAGFSFSGFASVDNARMLIVTAAGDVIVSQPRQGQVLLLRRDADGDGRSDGERVLLKDLQRPHGLAIRGGHLYVAETGAIGRVGFDVERADIAGNYGHIVDGLPTGGNHWSKSIAIGPDDKLYVSIGSTCNVCEEDDERRATVMQFDADGRNGRLFATGLRNSVGLAWAPWDDALYATDNGRDLLGDDFPPCELNRIVDAGFYGWPYFNGDNIADPDLGGRAPEGIEAIRPLFGFRAHNAPLGMTFVNAEKLPADFQRSALVALHGSWNRSAPDGYKVISLHWMQDGNIVARDFMTGFESDGDIIGRPVDVAQAADGCIFVSDDFAGMIYRVCRDD